MAERQDDGREREQRSWRPLRRAAEALIALLTIGSPLIIGGVDPHVLVSVALLGGFAVLLTIFGRRESIGFSPAGWALAGAGLLAVFSTIPLPAPWTAALTTRSVPLASFPGEPVPGRVPLSLDVPATLVDSARLWGLLCVFLAASCLATRRESGRRLVQWVGLAGVFTALVSFAHVALGMTSYYGIVPHTFSDRGLTLFLDANSGASLAVLSTLACLGLSAGINDAVAQTGWRIGALVCLLMAIATQSVGGLLAMALAACIFLVRTLWRKIGITGTGSAAGAVGAGAGVFGLLGAAIAAGILYTDSWNFVRAKTLNKIDIWPTAWRMIRDEWRVGVGAGTFVSSFEPYMGPAHTTTATHPENFFLQWAAEFGLVPAVLAVLAFVVTFWMAFRVRWNQEDRVAPLHDAMLAATVAVLLHDLADFGLEFAGVGVAFVVALGFLSAQSGPFIKRKWIPALAGAASLASAVVAARSGLPRLLAVELEDALQKTAGMRGPDIDKHYRAIRARHPVPYLLPMRAALALEDFSERPIGPKAQQDTFARMTPYLDRAAELTQNDPPWFTRTWLEFRLGHRDEALRATREAYVRGNRYYDLARMALRNGATPAQLVSVIGVLKGRERREDYAVEAAGGLLPEGSLAADAVRQALEIVRLPRLRRLLSEAVRDAVERGELPTERGVLLPVCDALASDASCSRDSQYGCDSEEASARIAIEAVRLGEHWMAELPGDSRSFSCAASGYAALGGMDERIRTLVRGMDRFPGDVTMLGSYAWAKVEAHRPLDAIAAVKDIVPETQEPEAAYLIRSVRMNAYWDAGQHAKALREAMDTVQQNPEAWWAYSLAATQHELAHRYDAAIQIIESGGRLGGPGEAATWLKRLKAEKDAEAMSADAIRRAVDTGTGGTSGGSSGEASPKSGGRRHPSIDPVTRSKLDEIEMRPFR